MCGCKALWFVDANASVQIGFYAFLWWFSHRMIVRLGFYKLIIVWEELAGISFVIAWNLKYSEVCLVYYWQYMAISQVHSFLLKK